MIRPTPRRTVRRDSIQAIAPPTRVAARSIAQDSVSPTVGWDPGVSVEVDALARGNPERQNVG
jgi:hypothetical protein